MKPKAKLSSVQIKALAKHLGGKPMTRKMPMLAKEPAKLMPMAPGMDDGDGDDDSKDPLDLKD